MGYVYILSNQSMPGLIKIGSTDRTAEERAAELSSTTGVPIPFSLEVAAPFYDHIAAERSLHSRFSEARVRDGREFFTATVQDARTALIELKISVTMQEVENVAPDASTMLLSALAAKDPEHPAIVAKKLADEHALRDVLKTWPIESLSRILTDLFQQRAELWRRLR